MAYLNSHRNTKIPMVHFLSSDKISINFNRSIYCFTHIDILYIAKALNKNPSSPHSQQKAISLWNWNLSLLLHTKPDFTEKEKFKMYKYH